MSQTWVFVILGAVALVSLAASIAIWVYLWRTRRRRAAPGEPSPER